ncbi:MAG: sugar ABC transporter permease, partial [Rhodospirillales bacterium]|nr:sugar ABC transporter permease [Rhodospirillales bacterium]
MAIATTVDNPAVAPVVSRSVRRSPLAGTDRLWALAFVTPYVAVFCAFVLYPVGYGMWLGSDVASYRQLLADPVFPSAVVNTLIYLLVAVNLKLLLALLLSGLFMGRGWWRKLLLLIFILPWAVPGIPSFISIHWMLNSQWGLINNAIWAFFQVDGPPWLDNA